jgi:hypothetical protein
MRELIPFVHGWAFSVGHFPGTALQARAPPVRFAGRNPSIHLVSDPRIRPSHPTLERVS